jgi:hypothetical protein
MLTPAQLVTLRAAIDAETDPNMVQWRTPATRADNQIAAWLNLPSTTDAWRVAADPALIDDAPSYVDFDTLTAGKRDSWLLFMTRARNFTRNKTRAWVKDIWGNVTAASNSEKILQAAVEQATHGEAYLGGTVRVEGTVSALDRAYVGAISIDDVANALNL